MITEPLILDCPAVCYLWIASGTGNVSLTEFPVCRQHLGEQVARLGRLADRHQEAAAAGADELDAVDVGRERAEEPLQRGL